MSINIELANNDECTGCAACANICPKKAIKMVENRAGFIQPIINKNKCVRCSMCVKACPVINDIQILKKDEKRPKMYGAKCKDSSIRFKSTSGGIFATISRTILKNGGIVAGAIYENPYYVKHSIAYDESQIEPLLQSKYVQSNIGYIYREISENLKKGKQVLFCGTPCQVAGLYSFLNERPEKLLTCDFICYGVNSPKAYRKWLNEIHQKYGKIERVWFKYKKYGWYNSPMCTRIDFSDKSKLILDKDNNYYMLGYVYDALYIRNSCGHCKFKGIHRSSDITLGDFWGIDNELDDDKGTSIIILNNKKGKKIFENIKRDIIWWKTDLEVIIKGNHMISECVNINDKSLEFLYNLDKVPFSRLYRRYSTKNKYNIKW